MAILVGDKVVTLLRDDLATIPWPNHWDLPGGAREGAETPVSCALRETFEELGLVYGPQDIHWSAAWATQRGLAWFFVAERATFDRDEVVFGNEGQGWELVDISWFVTHDTVVPALRDRMVYYLNHVRTMAP